VNQKEAAIERRRIAALPFPEQQRALWGMVVQLEPLVRSIARRFSERTDDDLQDARLAVYDAVRRWDPDRGGGLNQQASWAFFRRVWHRRCKDGIHVPSWLASNLRSARWRHGAGPGATLDDLAALEGIEPVAFAVAWWATSGRSPVDDGGRDEHRAWDNLVARGVGWSADGPILVEHAPESAGELADLRVVEKAMEKLSERERDCLLRVVVGGEKLVDVGKSHGLSRERVRQIVTKALYRLREACNPQAGG
jgi:RNA polymerase sigma factor (sigma-70 family)